MVLRMANPQKHPRTGVYWFRQRVPADLIEAVGKKEVTKTLGTKDIREARTRYAAMAEEVSREWEMLRRKPVILPHRIVMGLAGEAYRTWVELNPDEPGTPAIWENIIRLHREAEDRAGGLAIGMNYERLERWLGPTVDVILRENELRVEPETRKRLLIESNRAMIQAAEQRLREASGDYRPDPNAARFPPVEIKTGGQPTVSLLGLFDAYASETKLKPKTARTWRNYVAELVAFIGHDDAKRLAKPDVVRWKDSLVLGGKLKAKTINMGRLTAVRTALAWAEANSHIASNPAKGVKVSATKASAPPVRGFTDGEAETILRAARGETKLSRRWLPWLAALTGARIAELANLRGCDVSKVDDLWLITFSPDAGPLKTQQSARTIPVHPALVDEGFPTVAAEAGEGVIFADLSPGKDGNRGHAASHVMTRWMRNDLGMTDTAIAPNHSWRHRFRTLCHRHEIPEEAIDAIEGHAPKTQGQRYGERPIQLMMQVKKLPYPLV